MKKLQEIKQKYKDNFFNFNYFNIYSDDYDWLLHQVERMDELEGNYNHLNESFRLQTNSAVDGWEKVIELEKENEHLKQAWEIAKTKALEWGAGKNILDSSKEKAYRLGAQDMHEDFVDYYETSLEASQND